MIVCNTVAELKAYRSGLTGSVGFVPTMGALHRGHLSLIERSLAGCETTVASIYVNPTQFNNIDDLANYPDTLQEDMNKLVNLGVDCLFLPDYAELYPDDFTYQVDENSFSRELCGSHRPGHFAGVLTVVMKLFNLVNPSRAYFGEKDFQQLTLIRNMVDAFFLDVEVVGCPTVREKDGLAMSSRNLNLMACDRRRSRSFQQILRTANADGEAREQLNDAGFEVDYVTTVDGRRYGAVILGPEARSVRLIDNFSLGAL
jgi:pantoate--beta-alanine ligase